MKKMYLFVAALVLPCSAFTENWIPDYGYYDSPREISAKDRIIPYTSKIFDFEKSANPGGEKIEKGRYYIETKYQGGYKDPDPDYIYLDEIAGQDGKHGKNGKDGKDADMSLVHANTNGLRAQQSQIITNTNAIHELQETKYVIEASIRFYDTQRLSARVFGNFDVRHNKAHEVGLRFGLKLGTSYEERRINELELLIKELQSIAHRPSTNQVLYFLEERNHEHNTRQP